MNEEPLIEHDFDRADGRPREPVRRYRAPSRVLRDVEERWETLERARDIYGVVLKPAGADDRFSIDEEATQARRAELGARAPVAVNGSR